MLTRRHLLTGGFFASATAAAQIPAVNTLPAAAVADLGVQTIASAPVDTNAASKASTQAAVDNLRTDLNTIKARLRAQGIIAS